MRKQVYMYRAKAIAGPDNVSGFTVGGRHTVLVFIGDYSNQYDWQRAERIASQQGWLEIEFDKAGRISMEQVATQDATIRQCYAQACETGESMVAFAAGE